MEKSTTQAERVDRTLLSKYKYTSLFCGLLHHYASADNILYNYMLSDSAFRIKKYRSIRRTAMAVVLKCSDR